MAPDRLSVVFCWAEVAGYMPACWRSLSRRPGVSCHILHPQQLAGNPANPFELSPLMGGLSHEMFGRDRPDLHRWLVDSLRRHDPDVIVLCGWTFWPYVAAVEAPELSRARVVIGMDTPWLGTLAQRVGGWRLRRVIRRTTAVITAGERSAEYARRLGMPPDRIHHGYYGFDRDPLVQVAPERCRGRWPRQFLFVGRYVAQKDLRTLVDAYRDYRQMVSDPWGLTCQGTGPDAHLLHGVDGLVDAGFAQPAELPGIYRRHGAFVMPSKFEPWGVVIAEAAASGLPIVCTNACGASVDLVREYYNGLIVGAQDAPALARAMRWIHEHEALLPAMGDRGRGLADAFSAESWGERWHHYLLGAATAPPA